MSIVLKGYRNKDLGAGLKENYWTLIWGTGCKDTWRMRSRIVIVVVVVVVVVLLLLLVVVVVVVSGSHAKL